MKIISFDHVAVPINDEIGIIQIDGVQFQWEIFAGGSGYLYNKTNEKDIYAKLLVAIL